MNIIDTSSGTSSIDKSYGSIKNIPLFRTKGIQYQIDIHKFENKYYIEIDTDSTEFEKDPIDQSTLISVAVNEVDKYLRIESSNINKIFNNIEYSYFYINQITLFNDILRISSLTISKS